MRPTRLILGPAAALVTVTLAVPAAAVPPSGRDVRTAGSDRKPAAASSIAPAVPSIAFDAARNVVTVTVSGAQIDGVPPSRLRPGSFTVLEDGVRQDATVAVEHAPVTVAVLLESGGRSYELNRMLVSQTSYVVRPLLDRLGPDDRLAVFRYDDELHPIVDFATPRERWDPLLSGAEVPRFSEANFYDAAAAVLDQMAPLPGRKAMLIVSTGVDTFSHTTFADLKRKAADAGTPIYVFALGPLARQRLNGSVAGPASRIDWATCDDQLRQLADVTGGRAYVESSTAEVPAFYDDMMEHLRLRYVLRYTPSRDGAEERTVQVRVTEDGTAGSRPIAAASRRDPAPATQTIAEGRYRTSEATAARRADAGS